MGENNKDFGLTLVLKALKSCSYSTITASASIFFNINHWNSLQSNRKSNKFTELICVFDCGAIYSEDICVFTK